MSTCASDYLLGCSSTYLRAVLTLLRLITNTTKYHIFKHIRDFGMYMGANRTCCKLRHAHGEAAGSFLLGNCQFLRLLQSDGFFILREVPSTPSLYIPISPLLPGGRLALTGRDRHKTTPEPPYAHPTGPGAPHQRRPQA